MTKPDTYRTLEKPSSGFYKEKGSKFYSFAFPVQNEDDVVRCLDEVRKEHHKARHHCYAWKLDFEGNAFRMNDDGEPSGTAGRPIFGQLESFDITKALIIVVRYFGGTLLGASGLIRSYKEAAADALANGSIVDRFITDDISIHFDYGDMSSVMSVIKDFDAEMIGQEYELNPVIKIRIRKSLTDDFIIHLKAAVLQVSLEEAMTKEKIDHLKIEVCSE